jgi:uridine phosphorylase
MSGLVFDTLPIIADKNRKAASVFTAKGLLDAARLQKGLAQGSVPPVCVLDPDTDLVRHLRENGRAERVAHWACYHTDLYRMRGVGGDIGFVAGAVGAPFAVLVAEQLFASGCRLLISITSAGQLVPLRDPPYMILIDKALRDEGTSYHYAAPARFAHIDGELLRTLAGTFDKVPVPVVTGATWTTDAPFRETAEAISSRRAEGLLAVEMEAAALYALAQQKNLPIVCFALVTNQMAQSATDFDKGAAHGAHDAMAIIEAVASRFRAGAHY